MIAKFEPLLKKKIFLTFIVVTKRYPFSLLTAEGVMTIFRTGTTSVSSLRTRELACLASMLLPTLESRAQGDKNGNCWPGLVVDKDIGHPQMVDFYLQSQAAIIGSKLRYT